MRATSRTRGGGWVGANKKSACVGTDSTNQGESVFSFFVSLYAGDATKPVASRAALLAATNATYDHLRKFGLLMHVGSAGKRSKTEAMYCQARNEDHGDGDTSGAVLD